MERENPMFKEAVKLAITPMISSLSLMENANSESEVLSIGISVIVLNLGMYLKGVLWISSNSCNWNKKIPFLKRKKFNEKLLITALF